MEKKEEALKKQKPQKAQPVDLADIGKLFARFFERYHSIVFFVTLAIGVGVCIIIIIDVLNVSSIIDVSEIPTVSHNFDEQTIRQLDQLKDRSSTGPFRLPSGRTNPFVE